MITDDSVNEMNDIGITEAEGSSEYNHAKHLLVTRHFKVVNDSIDAT
jgi:hypothetical protein